VRHFFRAFSYCAVSVCCAGFGIVVSQSPSFAAGPAYAWNGCYVGAQAGVATSGSHWGYTNSNAYTATGNTDPQLVSGANFSDNRGVIGLQGGCNRALADYWVAGIEGSWFTNPMNLDRDNNFIPFPQDPDFNYREIITTKIQSVFSITGRLGVASSADWLLYGKGGYAAARIDTAGRVSPQFYPPVFDFETRAWHSGWTAGLGVEYRLMKNVTIGAEYNYYSFGTVAHSGAITATDFDANGNPRPASPVNHDVNASVQTLMARVNFRLGEDGSDANAGPFAAYAAYLKAPPAPQPAAAEYSAFLQNELRYNSWSGTRGTNVFDASPGKGYQVYSPTSIGIDYAMPSEYKIETRLKGGYVYSSHNTANQIARYDGPVDTQASVNLTLLNFEKIQPQLGVALNLPTGNAFLPNNQRFARMDPDLVDVGSYGVGLNVNPTAGFTMGLNENTAVSLAAGYAWQGDFQREAVSLALTPNGLFRVDRFDIRSRVDPGDTFTANGNISTTVGNLVLAASFAYMAETRIVIDGVAGGRTGARFTSNTVASYKFDDFWSLAINVSWNFAEKNKVVDAFGFYVTEPQNSNSHVVIGSIEPTYRVSDKLRFGVNYSFLYRNANYYDQLQDQFIPAKQKHSAGASATYSLTPAADLTLTVAHAWIKQEDSAFLATTFVPPPTVFAFQPPMLSYQSWTASIKTTLTF